MTFIQLLSRFSLCCVLATACTALGTSGALAQAPADDASDDASVDGNDPGSEGSGSTPAPDEDVSAMVERLAAEGNALVGAADFEGAIARYLEAYRLSQAGALLYNIAYIYDRKIGQPELALEHYKRYLGAEDAEPDIVRRALDRIRALQGAGVGKPRGDGGGGTGRSRPQPRRQSSDSSGSAMRIAGFAIGGLGLASSITGGVFGGLALSTRDEFSSALGTGARSTLKRRGESQAVLADAFLWPGLALTATGLVLILLAPSDDDDDSDTASTWELRPAAAAGPDGVVMGVEGAW